MLDLFKDIVPVEKQHQNYRLISTSPYHENERILIEQWSEGFQDRDGKFAKEFQTSFNSCFWELYLYQCFNQLGFDIDFSYPSPDFIVNSEIGNFAAEATITNNPSGFVGEHEADFNEIPKTADEFEKILYLASTRIANSFTSKHNRYDEYYQKLDHVIDKPFVVCIAPFEQPFAFIQNDTAVRRVLYGFNEPLYFDDPTTGERIFTGTSECPIIYKQNGAEIKLGFFTDERFSNVSAVIFSSTATMTKARALSKDNGELAYFVATRYDSQNKAPFNVMATKEDYFETLLDGLHIYINPFAKKRLNTEHFDGHEIAMHYYLPKEKYYYSKVPHGFLISHGCMTFTTGQKERIIDIKTSCRKKNTKTFNLPKWPTDKLVYVGGGSGPFTDNYMAHWNSHTIIVVRDEIDNDWCAQALPGTYYNTAWYFKANRETESKGLLLLQEICNSKEEAFEQIKKMIDQEINKQ